MPSPAKKIYQHLFKRRLPYGLFSWRFLIPNQPDRVCFHRKIAMQHFPDMPRSLSLAIILITGFKWAFFYSPYYTLQTVRLAGKTLREETGIPLWQQYWRVLLTSMGHGLAPANWYTFRLYQHKRNLWNHVYEQETAGFHAYRNLGRPLYREHAALLSDKSRFEEYLKKQKIATAGTIKVIPKSTPDFHKQLKLLTKNHERLFCKRRTGNQGHGAFSAFTQDGCLQIQPRKRHLLPTNEVADFLSTNIQKHNYLAQPEYNSHPKLKTVTHGYLHPASTIRVISHFHKGHVSLKIAILLWPVINEKKNINFYYPIAIEPYSGILNKAYPEWPRNNLSKTQENLLTLLIKNIGNEPLPFWQEAAQLVRTIHPLVNGVDQIAWDLILSEERAVLLEGNSGWGGLAVYQWFGYDIQQHVFE